MLLSNAIKKALKEELEIESEIQNDFILDGVSSIKEAKENEICYIDKPKYINDLKNSKAGAIFIHKNMLKYLPNHIQGIVVSNPHLAFALISNLFIKNDFNECKKNEIHENALISSKAVIGDNVKIGANSVIMAGVVIGDNVEIKENCKIYPNVVIYGNSVINNRVIIHAGSVIGSDGFGYAHTKDGRHIKIQHYGKVVIEDDVEIGANSVVDRSVCEVTHIKKGVKIDNLVQIGHNCIIGEHSILVSQVGLAGSTTMGRNVVMGGQAGTGGHIHIGDFVQIAGRGAVGKNLPPNTKWGGHPLMELNQWMQFFATLRRVVKKGRRNPKI